MSFLKEKIAESIESIKPNGSEDIQTVVLAAEVMVVGVVPAIIDLLDVSPYVEGRTGNMRCLFCETTIHLPHKETCPYERLKLHSEFLHNQFSPVEEVERDS